MRIRLIKDKTTDKFTSFEYFEIYIDGSKLEKTKVSKSIDFQYYDYSSYLGVESRKLAEIDIDEFNFFKHISLDNLFDWTDIENNLFLMLDDSEDKSKYIDVEISIGPIAANWSKDFSFADFCKVFKEFWNDLENQNGELGYTLDSEDLGLWLTNTILYENKSIRNLISENEKLFKEIYDKTVQKLLMKNDKDVSYDYFISHASEDKEDFVRLLAEALRKEGFKVWFDEFELKVGDKLRRAIDKGLANSKFGIVVISPNFFRKNWTQYELDGLVQREMLGEKAILPLWHKVSKDEVMQFSPSLADTVALNTTMFTIEELVKKLSEVFK